MTTILTALCTLFFGNSLAQDRSILAQQAWQSAEQQYELGEYSKALELLDKAEKHLGKTNPPILYLKVLANKNLFERDNTVYEALRKDIELFFKTVDANTYPKEKYMEIISIRDQVEEFKKTDEVQVRKLVNTGTLSEVRAYMANNRNTFYLPLLQQKEAEILVVSGSSEEIRAYLQQNSDSPYSAQLAQREETLKQSYKAELISRIEDLDVNIAKRKKKQMILLATSGGLTALSTLALVSGTKRLKDNDDDTSAEVLQTLGAAGLGGCGMWFLLSFIPKHGEYKAEKIKLEDELKHISSISIQPYGERIHQTAFNGLSLKLNF